MSDNELAPRSGENPARLDSSLNNGSSYDWLKHALGIMMGKTAPLGFDRASNMLAQDPGSVRPIHHLWVMAEARHADRLDDVYGGELGIKEAETPRKAFYIASTFMRDHPQLVETALRDLNRMPDVTSPAEERRNAQYIGVQDILPLLLEPPTSPDQQ